MKQITPYLYQKRLRGLLIVLIICLSQLSIGQTTTENYVTTKTYKVPSSSSINNPNVTQATQQVTYFDGLGRPIQQIAKGLSGGGNDLVTHIEYDALGRQEKQYLPYERSQSSLDIEANALSDTHEFYAVPYFQNTQNPYSQKEFENSPLNRVFKQSAPGNSWAMGSGREIQFDYQANSGHSNSRVFNFEVGETASNPVLMLNSDNNGIYPANHLYKNIMRDENWGEEGLGAEVIEYKNKLGQVVLMRRRSKGGQETTDTHYIYDEYGNLTFVIPPLLAEQIVVGPNLVANHQYLLDELGYQYKYDKRNRLSWKKLPGRQGEFMVYDALNRVVAIGPVHSPFADENGEGWLFTKYDAFNRVVYTLWKEGFVNESEQNILQDLINNQSVISETAIPEMNDVNGVAFAYTNDVHPTYGYHILTVNYYDRYDFPGAPGNVSGDVFGQEIYYSQYHLPKGLPTGSWVRALETSSETNGAVSFILYDYKDRPIRVETTNYLEGFTRVDTHYDFSGKVLETETTHKMTAQSQEIVVLESFDYTPQDRLESHFHSVNGNDTQMVSHNSYDAIGQLTIKKVGGIDDQQYFQKVDYKYNIRGWLTDINNINSLAESGAPQDLFAFKIHYNTVHNSVNGQVKPLYNGNISETFWRTSSDNIRRKYGYAYDYLNRLLDAWYQVPNSTVPLSNSYNEHLTYDKNGNILTLNRNGESDDPSNLIEIDELVYEYDDGNKLINVTDATNHPAGFDDGNDHSGIGGQDDFEYDGYGNMIVDRNKGIEDIIYNHFNLPKTIIFANGIGEISYLYDANGVKLKKTVNSNSITNTHYLDGFQYTEDHLDFFFHAEGYVNVIEFEEFNYVYTYKDHLGSIRLRYALDPSTEELTILEEDHYYPFGLKHRGYNSEHEIFERETSLKVVLTPVSPFEEDKFKYKFNGMEWQNEMDLNYYDFGARNYDPALGRWMNIDPLAEKMRRHSPYNYAFNNPIFFIDPDGMMAEEFESPTDEIEGRMDGAVGETNGGGGRTGQTTTYEKGEGGTHYVNTIQISDSEKVDNDDGTTSFNRTRTITRTIIEENPETGAAEVVGTNVSTVISKAISRVVNKPDPEGAFINSTVQTTETTETPISTSTNNIVSDVHTGRVNLVQNALNSLPSGMSLTQDRDALNNVVRLAAAASYAYGAAQGLRIISNVGARANIVTAGALTAYGLYDNYDRKNGDHTGRRALIGQ